MSDTLAVLLADDQYVRRPQGGGTVLMLGEATVKTHVSRFLAKLSARDRIQLVVLGFQAGIHE